MPKPTVIYGVASRSGFFIQYFANRAAAIKEANAVTRESKEPTDVEKCAVADLPLKELTVALVMHQDKRWCASREVVFTAYRRGQRPSP